MPYLSIGLLIPSLRLMALADKIALRLLGKRDEAALNKLYLRGVEMYEELTSTNHGGVGQNSEQAIRQSLDLLGQFTGTSISFGPFSLFPKQRLLLENGRPVRIGCRALEILIALLERPGEIVKKRELIVRVWPDPIVEETNLKVHVAALRRALGEDQIGRRYISTVIGRGYCFVAPVVRSDAAAASSSELSTVMPPFRRSDLVNMFALQLSRQRFIMVDGARDLAKGLTLATALMSEHQHGAYLVDLAQVDDPTSIPIAISMAIGIRPEASDPVSAVLEFLQDKDLLLVLDNCRNVVGATAVFASKVIGHAQHAHILAIGR